MKSSFAFKLALNNIGKGRKFFIPYILASAGMMAIFYIMLYVAFNKEITKLQGADSLKQLLLLGSVIVAVFAAIFIIYINGFLMKRRNKEIGLYSILGMEKRHIGKVLLAETFISFLSAAVAGIASGAVFSHLVVLLTEKLLKGSARLSAAVSLPATVYTLILFGIIFLLVLAANQKRIIFAKPIEILREANVGEKEPKANVIFTLLGIVCMVAGYSIANMVREPLEALVMFFTAVILVIIGTYLLFTTVSIAILKRLKGNRKIYYKKNNFTTISGMLFRMKQNAVGMANICIISTMVLVLVSTVVCMKFSSEETIEIMSPHDFAVSCEIPPKYIGKIDKTKIEKDLDMLNDEAKKEGVKVSGINGLTFMEVPMKRDKKNEDLTFEFGGNMSFVNFVTEKTFNRQTGKNVSLKSGEIIQLGGEKNGYVCFENLKFRVKSYIKDGRKLIPANTESMASYIFVVRDQKALNSISREAMRRDVITLKTYKIMFNAKDDKRMHDFVKKYARKLEARPYMEHTFISKKSEFVDRVYGITGGFLLIGILLGSVFMVAAALIIYYKQISEGYYDREKFIIMQKVGMSQKEVKKSIRKQILAVFFTPLILAAMHMAGAFNMMYRLLGLFNFNNIWIFVGSTLATMLVFAVIYAIIYMVTAREYYKIVSRGAGN